MRAVVGRAVAACLAGAALGCGGGSPAGGPRDAAAPTDVVEDFVLFFMESAAPEDAGDDAGAPSAAVSVPKLDLGPLPCGGPVMGSELGMTNNGGSPLKVSGTISGAGFTMDPLTFTIPPGSSQIVTVNGVVPASVTAGAMMTGTIVLATNDPENAMLTIPLAATAQGATLAFQQGAQTTIAFPDQEVGHHSTNLPASLVNSGNDTATFDFSPPSDSHFLLAVPDGGVTLGPGEAWLGETNFTPTDTVPLTATSTITASGTLCGTSLQSITFTGQGATGTLTGWPSTVDFGPAQCGGDAPASQSFQLMNPGIVEVSFTQVQLTGTPGFTTTASTQIRIPGGGALTIVLDAPSVPAMSALTPVTATLTIKTDADSSAHAITLKEEPSGAVLGFDTSPTPGFGSFGQVTLLESASQTFNVTNSGSGSATVTLTTAPTPPFTLQSSTFPVPGGGSVPDTVTFAPVSGLGVTGSVSMTATGAICGSLPSPISLAGSGFGGAPSVSPSSLNFYAYCGGAAPNDLSFIVKNNGTADMNWSMSAPSGAGASVYMATATPLPGLLIPGAESNVLVSAAGVPSPAPQTNPLNLAAQITITTDVPFDPPHVVSLSETPVGDQLAFVTQGPVAYGQIPVGSSMTNQVVVSNQANQGSQAASIAFTLNGSGHAAYTAPQYLSIQPGGGTAGASIVFLPTSAGSDPVTIGLTTNDFLCTPLPTPLELMGAGTQGEVQVSATTIAFGSDPNDPAGLVNCGATGLSHSFTVSNVGNQEFQITGLALGQGASSPFTLSGAGAMLPATVPIGGGVDITVSPAAIPQSVAVPDDASPFTDTLTVTTSAALDSPHAVSLVMQPRGAVIANTPLTTTWAFGATTQGSIGTFTNTIRNTGNAAASVSLSGLMNPAIFGLQNNPTVVAPNAVTSIVGQFTPPVAGGSWTDTGTLTVTTPQVFCAPLPAAWTAPPIAFSGASGSGDSVTFSGTLAFPTTDCGSASPAAQTIVLKNNTNAPLTFAATLNAGLFYTVTSPALGDGGAGMLPASGTATIVVTPNTITPGPGVQPGAAPYGDNLLVSVGTDSADSGSATPLTSFTIPITWTLNGAVLSLPDGQGPDVDGSGNAFYPADSTGGLTLPMANSGTAPVSVTFGINPSGAFSVSPAPPVIVAPNVGAAPDLVAAGSDAACPSTTAGTATFFYSGPVCQPFPWPTVNLKVCSGTF